MKSSDTDPDVTDDEFEEKIRKMNAQKPVDYELWRTKKLCSQKKSPAYKKDHPPSASAQLRKVTRNKQKAKGGKSTTIIHEQLTQAEEDANILQEFDKEIKKEKECDLLQDFDREIQKKSQRESHRRSAVQTRSRAKQKLDEKLKRSAETDPDWDPNLCKKSKREAKKQDLQLVESSQSDDSLIDPAFDPDKTCSEESQSDRQTASGLEDQLEFSNYSGI